MRTIWKVELWLLRTISHNLPDNATPIHLGMQGGCLNLWVLVDDSRPKVTKRYLVVGTGQVVPEKARYIGTAQDNQGFVWHAFELQGE